MNVGARVRLVSMKEIEGQTRLHALRPHVKLGSLGTVIHVGPDGLADVRFDPPNEHADSDVIFCGDTMVEVLDEEAR